MARRYFSNAEACHQIGEGAKNAVGPVLNGIVGRKAGTYADYSYSDANKNSGITWDEATLKEYLKNPRAKVPGTKMIFPGLPKDEDIDNVIAYLKQFGPTAKNPEQSRREPLERDKARFGVPCSDRALLLAALDRRCDVACEG